MSLISVISSMARGIGGVYTPPEPEIPGDLLPPVIVSMTATLPTKIRVAFNETVSATVDGWTFNNGNTIIPSQVTLLSGTIWDFTVSGLAPGQTITASYSMMTGSTTDIAGNELISFTNAPVINVVNTSPTSLTDFEINDFEVADFT